MKIFNTLHITGKKHRKKKLTKFIVISRAMYIAAAIAILTIIPAASSLFYYYYSEMGRQNGYTVEDLYFDFIHKQYGELYQKTEYNVGVGRKVTSDDAEYYAFAKCYDSAIDYHMYAQTGQKALANEALEKFQENEGKLNNRMFRDALDGVRNSYQVP